MTILLGHDLSKPKGRQAKAFLYNHMTSSQRTGGPYDFGELAESIRAVDPDEVEDVISAAALKELGRNAGRTTAVRTHSSTALALHWTSAP